jgi:hypothetical protein
MGTLSAAAQTEQEADYTKYAGKIGPYAITLFINMRSYGEEDAGYYYYNDRPQTKFTLKMMENEPNPKGFNKVVLYEYSPKGNHTGTFKGTVEGRGDGFNGTFTNGRGKKYEFQLMQQY